ncbi:MAG: DUF4331 family protein [Alphaproteobacteria bacterium]|nr:DUF4331 family protein [Alphaproteobacteria bacterium]
MFKRYAMAAALVAGAIFNFSPSAVAADHRDAPTIDDYSAIDINDIFMFRDPANTNNLVMVLSVQAIADPKFGPSYHFQPNALYQINFSTNAQAKPTASINVVFSDFANGPSCPAPQAACQTYRAFFPHGIVVEGLTTQGTAAATPNRPIITTKAVGGSTITAFAGPREDPFFFDLVGFNRFIAKFNATGTVDGSLFTHVDSFLGKNINAIAFEFPISLVAGNAPKFAAWAATYLGDLRFQDFDDHGRFKDIDDRGLGGLRQVDRMGNPAVNTALIPPNLKDAFNFGKPEDDARDFAPTTLATLAKFHTPAATVSLLASVAVPDTLKFDTSQPDGYPNGRRLADRVTDLLISLIVNIPGFTGGNAVKTYLAAFPFAGPPLQQTP